MPTGDHMPAEGQSEEHAVVLETATQSGLGGTFQGHLPIVSPRISFSVNHLARLRRSPTPQQISGNELIIGMQSCHFKLSKGAFGATRKASS